MVSMGSRLINVVSARGFLDKMLFNYIKILIGMNLVPGPRMTWLPLRDSGLAAVSMLLCKVLLLPCNGLTARVLIMILHIQTSILCSSEGI